MTDIVDVVIPARDEQETIGAVISTLKLHPAIGQVIVVIDKETTDDTAWIAVNAVSDNRDGWVLTPNAHGKGQCVRAGLAEVKTDHVLFCDADIKGLTYDHISLLLCNAIAGKDCMTIGVPDVPSNYPTDKLWAWRWVSGQRCVPTRLVKPLFLYGYLMETQLNLAARHSQLPVDHEWLRGLKSDYYMSERRLQAMADDARFGIDHGIIP